MRRKVRGTVSGIYMCSAALRRGSKRRHGSTGCSRVLQQNGFCAFFSLAPITSTNRVHHALAHLCERSSAEGSPLISRDNLTMINGSIVKRHAGR